MDVDETEVDPTGVHVLDNVPSDTQSRAVGRKGHPVGEEGEGIGADDPLAQGRYGRRRKRSQTLRLRDNRANMSVGSQTCHSCVSGKETYTKDRDKLHEGVRAVDL